MPLPPPNPVLRRQVIQLYKELLHMGKEYPQGYDYFRPRLHRAFMSKAGLRDEGEIKQAIATAQFVQKELQALYYLKKYRTLKKQYEGDKAVGWLGS
ncbi:NADH-ubiquinone oxidoreductase [Copromyces sp. CBS 386.78]|nr:NADH-ubiquinone oxidoreductase [Copromyces sp. CBS 386.78]